MTLPALCATFVYLGWTDDMYGVPRKTDVRPSMARRVAKYPKVQTWAGSETYLVAPAKWPTSIAWDVTPFEFANGPAAFAPLAHTAQVSCLGLRALTGYAMGVPEAALADWHDTAVAKLLAEMRTAISQLNETPIFVVWKNNTDLRRLPLLTDLSLPLEQRLRARAAMERPPRTWDARGEALKKNSTVWAAIKGGFAARPGRELHADFVRNEHGKTRRRKRVLSI